MPPMPEIARRARSPRSTPMCWSISPASRTRTGRCSRRGRRGRSATHAVAAPHRSQPLVDRVDRATPPRSRAHSLAEREGRGEGAGVAGDRDRARGALGCGGRSARQARPRRGARRLRRRPRAAAGLRAGALPARRAGTRRRRSGAAELEFDAALAIAPADCRARGSRRRKLALARHDAAAPPRFARPGSSTIRSSAGLLRTLGHAELARRDGAAATNASPARSPLDPVRRRHALQPRRRAADRNDLAAAARAYQRALAFSPTSSPPISISASSSSGRAKPTPRSTRAGARAGAASGAGGAHARCGDVLTAPAASTTGSPFPPLRGELSRLRWRSRCRRSRCCSTRAISPPRAATCSGSSATSSRRASEIELVDTLEQLLYLLLFFDVDPASRLSLHRRTTRRRSASTARRCRAGDAPPGTAPRRLPVGRPAQPRDGQDDLAGGAPPRPLALRHPLLFAVGATRRVDRAVRGARRPLRVAGGRCRSARPCAHRRRRSRHPGRPVDAHERREAGHPRAQAGARADHACRERRHASASRPIDFKLTDRYADLAGERRRQIETLLPMAGCVYPFRRVAPAADAPVPSRGPRHRRGRGADRRVRHADEAVAALSRALARGARARAARAARVLAERAALRGSYPRLIAAAGIDEARPSCCRRDATTPRTRRATR